VTGNREGWLGRKNRDEGGATVSPRLVAACLALLLVTAGCVDLAELPDVARPDEPDDDRLGWEDGSWYDDPVRVTADDGLNESERRAVVARTMARVERIRGLEFRESVPVEVITRAEYREQRGNRSGGSDTHEAWNDQVWEAALLVGEDRRVSEAFDTIYGTSVQGYYATGDDRIVLVSDSETPTVDSRTLAHELVHALQDQHFGFGSGADTQDRQLAHRGLTEGDANAVGSLYGQRCASEWSCLDRPERTRSPASEEFDVGVFLAVYTPYAEGPGFVTALRERGDWAAVNDAYDRFPNSTEQVIHPARYPDDDPVDVPVRDRSTDEWERFDHDPVGDTLGEATLYAMLWKHGRVDEDRDPYNYSHPAATGWGGDTVVPYTNGSHGAYVWKGTFDTREDAREFHDAYRAILESKDARSPRDGIYVVPEGDPFADAFRVRRSGDTLLVVNAPTVGDLDEVHDVG
jgi:hypothetical protein